MAFVCKHEVGPHVHFRPTISCALPLQGHLLVLVAGLFADPACTDSTVSICYRALCLAWSLPSLHGSLMLPQLVSIDDKLTDLDADRKELAEYQVCAPLCVHHCVCTILSAPRVCTILGAQGVCTILSAKAWRAGRLLCDAGGV